MSSFIAAAQQFNGREAKTAAFSNLNLRVFLPTSSQPLDRINLNNLKLMKTQFEDFEGSITELNGRECETLLCVQIANEESITPGIFWLKIRDGGWHRFFLDASFYFLRWIEHDELDNSDLEDEESYPVIDIGKRYNIENCKIAKIEMKQIQKEAIREGCLTIYFSQGHLLELKHSPEAAS